MTVPLTVLPPDYEPEDAFNQRLLAIVGSWDDGQLPFNEALKQLTALGEEASASGHRANQGRVELLLGVLHGYRANLETSIRHFERARLWFEAVGNRRRAVGALLNLGEDYRLLGNFIRARQYFRAAYDAAVELGDQNTQALASCNEGLIALSTEQYERAQQLLERAHALTLQLTDKTAADPLIVDIEQALAQVALHTGTPEAAWQHAGAALQHAQRLEQPFLLGTAYRAAGQVLCQAGPPPADVQAALKLHETDPDEYFRRASDQFQAVKAEGELARTMYVHALSLARRGRGMTAARKLQQAMILFTRLGMSDDAAKAVHAQMDVMTKTGG